MFKQYLFGFCVPDQRVFLYIYISAQVFSFNGQEAKYNFFYKDHLMFLIMQRNFLQ